MTIAPGRSEPDNPDSQLVSAVSGGDEAAFRALYRRHTPRLRMLVLRILGGHSSDSDDVLQETWVRAVTSLNGFRGESTFGTWLNGIGVRVAWGMIRRRSSAETITPDNEPFIEPPDTGERLDLDEALRRLPDQHRTVVVLHDVEGYSHEEIAESLGVAVGTSRSTLSRARQALRAMLSSYERITR
jgi:RNA polymerase sigma factor (sigma-70 family)